MDKRIIVDSSFEEETRVAFINGQEIEHFEVDTSSNKKQLKGNVYLAKVSRVEPSLQAALAMGPLQRSLAANCPSNVHTN